jgi:protocatechuate 3,4-dioxygenase beta subunit
MPQQTEGPFFVDERLHRSDIRIDPGDGSVRPGVPLHLAFRIATVDRGRCAALPGVMVDVWHCDALGHYSDEPANGTEGKKFLRGYQITDANGIAQFVTIYPGW